MILMDFGVITLADVIGWAIHLGSVGIAVAGLIYVARKFKQDTDSRYTETLSRIDDQVTGIERDLERDAAPDSINRARWESKFLNMFERLALFVLQKKYPDEFADFFQRNFQWARFLVENGEEATNRKRDFPHILTICNQEGWNAVNVV